MNPIPARFCPRCGAELSGGVCPRCVLRLGMQTQPIEPAVGRPFTAPGVEELARRLPGLEVLEFIGQGGMGAVYKARQRELDRLVAIKVLPVNPSADPAFAERFTREARALARLCHPNIVAVYDFGRTDDLCYFVMEFVEGVNLRQMIAARTLMPADALRIVPQVCEALQFAHDAGIVHRDVKPENILVDGKGRVKIADFGLAKLLDRSPADLTLTAEHHVMGTPRYMAPEQIERPGSVDHRADIYSLGVVLYEMLTGELPMGRFSPPSQKVHIDVRLDEVVLRTLEKEPARRYQQASEVKTDLGTLADADQRPPIRRGSKKSLGGASWFRQSRDERWWTKASFWAIAVIGFFMFFKADATTESRGGKTTITYRVGAPGAWLKWKPQDGRGLWRSLDFDLISLSFGAGVMGACCLGLVLRIHDIERRRARRWETRHGNTRERHGAPPTPAVAYTLSPGSGGPMLALAGAGIVISGLCMAVGLALAVMAFVREQPGSHPFWGWMGGAMGCFFGGAGGLAGSWNTYRQLTGRRDWMREPGITVLDRALRWYAALGLACLIAAAVGWRAWGDATRLSLLVLGGIVTIQGVTFLGIRRITRQAPS